jgi:hypothetical protein
LLTLIFFITASANLIASEVTQPEFITTWQTTKSYESITIPTNPEVGEYNYTVDWGDGTISKNVTADADHQYVSPGTYIFKI